MDDKSRRIAVIGAGVSGLTIARLLRDGNDVVVFEKDSRPGGLIKCDVVDGCLFHRTGGHVFNTRRQPVLDFFWSLFDKERDFIKADRNSVVALDGKFVEYPIENHVYRLGDDVLSSFINDCLEIAANGSREPENFQDFLLATFGKTLYELYFKPYNTKVWRRDLSRVPLSWLEGKLPTPSVAEMLFNNIRRVEEKAFVHSSFFYPVEGGSQRLADRLADGLDIRYSSDISSIKRTYGGWLVGGGLYDAVVYTGNIKALPAVLGDAAFSGRFKERIDALESHGTTTVFCEIERNPYSWVYQPSPSHGSHRIICTGNFSPRNNAPGRFTATVEFTDRADREEIERDLALMPFSPRYICHNYEEYTYPIQDAGTRRLIQDIRDSLSPAGFHLLGRFAEWEYYNMDAAMASALTLLPRI